MALYDKQQLQIVPERLPHS